MRFVLISKPTYLIDARGANANAGYVVSGFWGGKSSVYGTLCLMIRLDSRSSHLDPRHKEARQPIKRLRLVSNTSMVPLISSSVIALGFQLIVWLVPNYICSAVCICFIGFFLAPIFPLAIVIITETIPDELHVGVIGLFGTIGGAGAAAVPPILSAIADKVSLHIVSTWLRVADGSVRLLGDGSIYDGCHCGVVDIVGLCTPWKGHAIAVTGVVFFKMMIYQLWTPNALIYKFDLHARAALTVLDSQQQKA